MDFAHSDHRTRRITWHYGDPHRKPVAGQSEIDGPVGLVEKPDSLTLGRGPTARCERLTSLGISDDFDETAGHATAEPPSSLRTPMQKPLYSTRAPRFRPLATPFATPVVTPKPLIRNI